MQIIPAKYKGFQYRGWTEARWAVFFDQMGIEYVHEPEGIKFEDGTCYIPDFWLPQVEMWAEVKWKTFDDEELRKCVLLYKETGFTCLALAGPPAFREYPVVLPNSEKFTGDPDFHPLYYLGVTYTLITDYLDEKRFPAMFYLTSAEFERDEQYVEAVYKARSARFEFDDHR